jgi:hypothetical protein
MDKCKKYCEKRVKMVKTQKNKSKLTFAKMTKKIKSKSKTMTKEEKTQAKKQIKFVKGFEKLFNDKSIMKNCLKNNCNPGCKGTIYEDEPGTEYEKSLNKEFSKLPKPKGKITTYDLINLFLQQRKKLFNGAKSITIDNFAPNISTKKRNQMKRDGAISCCNRFTDSLI